MNKIFYVSDYAVLDSDVLNGGGTDQTEVIQGLLDKASELGSVHIIMDGAALVRGLQIHSNTTLECLNANCGFYLADQSNCPVLRNSNRSYDDRLTKNVTVIGGTYNQNCLHQEHHVVVKDAVSTIRNDDNPEAERTEFTVAMEFVGIENLVVRDVTVRDQRTFAFVAGNFRRVYIENVFIELDHPILWGNQDGFHFWGPGQYLTVRNVGGKTEDDFMNIGPDERDCVSSITDVIIDGVYLDDAYQGIRLLSRGTGSLDRVTIRNVSGTYTTFGFYINPWMISDQMGNFGSILFENINLRPLYNVLENHVTENPPFLFCIGGDFKSLTLRNIVWNEPYDNRNIFQIGYPWHKVYWDFKEKIPHIQTLTVDGLQITDNAGTSAEADYMLLRGEIEHLTLKNIEIYRKPENKGSGCFVKTRKDAAIGRVILDRAVLENIDTVFDFTSGKVNRLYLNQAITNGVETVLKGDASVTGEPIKE